MWGTREKMERRAVFGPRIMNKMSQMEEADGFICDRQPRAAMVLDG